MDDDWEVEQQFFRPKNKYISVRINKKFKNKHNHLRYSTGFRESGYTTPPSSRGFKRHSKKKKRCLVRKLNKNIIAIDSLSYKYYSSFAHSPTLNQNQWQVQWKWNTKQKQREIKKQKSSAPNNDIFISCTSCSARMYSHFYVHVRSKLLLSVLKYDCKIIKCGLEFSSDKAVNVPYRKIFDEFFIFNSDVLYFHFDSLWNAKYLVKVCNASIEKLKNEAREHVQKYTSRVEDEWQLRDDFFHSLQDCFFHLDHNIIWQLNKTQIYDRYRNAVSLKNLLWEKFYDYVYKGSAQYNLDMNVVCIILGFVGYCKVFEIPLNGKILYDYGWMINWDRKGRFCSRKKCYKYCSYGFCNDRLCIVQR